MKKTMMSFNMLQQRIFTDQAEDIFWEPSIRKHLVSLSGLTLILLLNFPFNITEVLSFQRAAIQNSSGSQILKQRIMLTGLTFMMNPVLVER